MPIAISCPGCAQVLNVPASLAGRKGKCPKCGTTLLIPQAAEAEAPARPAARKPRPSEPAIQKETALPPRRRVAAEVSEEDDSAAPEETAPRSRATRKKSKRKKSPVLLYSLLGGGCAGLLFLCSGVGVFAWWYFFSAGIDDDLKYMPNNSQFVASIRIDQLMQSAVFKELQREIPQIDKQTSPDLYKEIGLSPDDVGQVVFGGGANSKEFIAVVHTKKAIEARDIRAKIKDGNYTETKVGKYLMQEPQNSLHPAFCVVDKQRIVIGEKEGVRAVLTRDKKPEFSKNLQTALKEVDFSKTLVFAVDTQSARSKTNNGLNLFGGQNEMMSSFEKTNGMAGQVKIASDVRFEMTLFCQDAASANDVKKLLDGFLVMGRNNKDVPAELKGMMELNLKTDGNKVTGSNTFKVGPLIQIYKQGVGKRL